MKPEYKQDPPSNFEAIKKKAVKCVRCGASILVHGQEKIFFCDECRGRQGTIKLHNWRQLVGHSTNVDALVQGLRR